LLPLIIQEESPVTHGNPLIKKKNKYETALQKIPMGANFRLGKKGDSLIPLVGMGEPTYGGRALV